VLQESLDYLKRSGFEVERTATLTAGPGTGWSNSGAWGPGSLGPGKKISFAVIIVLRPEGIAIMFSLFLYL